MHAGLRGARLHVTTRLVPGVLLAHDHRLRTDRGAAGWGNGGAPLGAPRGVRFKPSLTAQVSRAVQEGNAPQGRVAAGKEAAERLDIEQGNAIVAVSHLQVNNSLVLLIYALSLKLLFLLQSSEVCSVSVVGNRREWQPAHPAVGGLEADCQRRPGREFG